MSIFRFSYLALILFTVSYPLFKSFEDKLKYHRKWKFLFPGIFISAAFFIIWDVVFTEMGIWNFNSSYILGITFLNLPIEEWLFFLVTPFACVFIYEVMNYFVKSDVWGKASKTITLVLVIVLLLLALFFHDRLYTFVVCSLLAIFLLFIQFALRAPFMGRFYVAWAVCTVPFLLVNGLLTYLPVVSYNSNAILNFRIFTIPLEDLFYGMLNFLQVLTIYELLQKNSPRKR